MILGAVQGVTEWLPVSSSGHLALAQRLFGLEAPLAFDVLLHLGSLVVVCVFFRKELWALASGVARWEREQVRLAALLLAASVPIALAGFFFRAFVADAFVSMRAVGLSLLFTALLLFLSRYSPARPGGLSLWKSLVVGVAQAVALLPGVSRSGSTISTGMLLGVGREDAARFSFLLFIPAIIGATVVELPGLAGVDGLGVMALGAVVAAAVGFLSLGWLMRVIAEGRFSWFAAYCLVLGVVVLALG